MLGRSGSSCVMCGHSSVDLVSETFVSTPTLQVTLEKLRREVPAVHKFNFTRLFERITSRGGSCFCWPCLAALHGGMSVVSQISRLEQRLKKFAGCIGRRLACLEEIVGYGTHHQRMEGDLLVGEEVSLSSVPPESKCPEHPIDTERTEKCATTDTDLEDPPEEPHRKLRKLSKGRREVSTRRKLSPKPSTVPPVSRPSTRGNSSLTSKAPGTPIPIKQTEECLTTDTDVEESSQEPSRQLRNRSTGRRDSLPVTSRRNKTTKPSTALPVSPSTPKSDSSLPSKAPKIPGVEKCPSCDFSVDVRTPAEAKSSNKLAPYKTLEALRKSARQKVARHYRDNHMLPESKTNVKLTKDGIKLFLCPQCPFKSVQSCKLAEHYFSIHVLNKKKPPTQLSCPVQGCSYIVDIPVRRGIFKTRQPQRHLKETLATHVLKEHDIPSVHSNTKYLRKLYKNTITLHVETVDNEKEYHCTRCDLVTRLPKQLDKNQGTEYRRNFLRHFYDSHLSSSL